MPAKHDLARLLSEESTPPAIRRGQGVRLSTEAAAADAAATIQPGDEAPSRQVDAAPPPHGEPLPRPLDDTARSQLDDDSPERRIDTLPSAPGDTAPGQLADEAPARRIDTLPPPYGATATDRPVDEVPQRRVDTPAQLRGDPAPGRPHAGVPGGDVDRTRHLPADPAPGWPSADVPQRRVDAAPPPHGDTVAAPRGEMRQPEHVKLTFYLPPELADALEQCWQALRRQAPAAVRPRITRSLVAEHALRHGLAGLADERGRAQLLQALGAPARAP